MSISSSIDIKFTEKVDPIILIESFLNNGWSLDDFGHISYLPVNDGGRYDWEWLDTSESTKFMSIIRTKNENGEVIGVAFTWEKSEVGFEMLLWESRKCLSLMLSINRKQISESSSITDFSWYFEKLSLVLKSIGATVDSLTCEQDRV